MIEQPGKKRVLGRKLIKILPQRGHTTGYYMARVILEHETKRNLVKCVGNPFQFIILYNEAAVKSRGKYQTFSKKSINFLRELAAKYSI
jgi:hypothetical protein